MSPENMADQVAALRAEVARQDKIIAALIARAEAAPDQLSSDFGLFEATVRLEDQVRSRTRELNAAMRELESSNRALSESRARLQAIFELMPNPVALSSLDDNTLLDVSHSFADFFGYRPDEMIGRATGPDGLALWADPAERQAYREAVDRAAGGTVRFEGRARRRDGEIAHVVLSGRTVTIEERRFLVSDLHDVTEATRQGERLRRLSEHDALTGLPNRLLVLERLHQAIATAQRNGAPLAVCYLDLDGFKAVNDCFGHRSGDHVLTEAAHRLAAAVRASDTVGRLGGDEFAILLPGMAAGSELDDILGRILAAIRRPYAIDERMIEGIGASIGYTVYPEDAGGPQTLLEHADQAMYATKRAGKNHSRRFCPAARA